MIRVARAGMSSVLPDLFRAILHVVEDVQLSARQWTSSSQEDFEAVRAMGSGNHDAAKRIYDRHSDGVYRFIYRRIGERPEDAEELTLDTFLSAIELAPKFDGRSSVFGWLCGIAKVRMIDHHRRQNAAKRASIRDHLSLSDERLAEIHADPDGPQQWFERMSARELLDLALKGLTDDELEVVTLRLVEGHSSKESAALTGRSERAVESILLRARAKLRKGLVALVSQTEAAE